MKSSVFILLLVTIASAKLVEEFSLENQTVDEDADSSDIDQHSKDISDFEASTAEEQQTGLGHWCHRYRIAFSAYLGRTFYHLGYKQTVKFDQVLLNDGNGYNRHTGVFRPKVSGVYMFTYVIAQRHHNEIQVALMYNGNVVNGAIAEGIANKHDAQGTNTAIIHVRKGESVWVEVTSHGRRIEGNTNHWRFTTFSGFLLYARR